MGDALFLLNLMKNKSKAKNTYKSINPHASRIHALSDEDFIDAFVKATEERTDLKSGNLIIKRKLKNSASGSAIEEFLAEARSRAIPLEVIAQRIVARTYQGKSFVSTLVSPLKWKKFEMQAAKAIIKLLEADGFIPDHVDFDARIFGRVTKSIRQVDLWLERSDPRHFIAVECKEYKSTWVSVEKIEAFRTKMADIEADKGYFITNRGYQQSAQKTAEHYGIVLMTLQPVDKENPPPDLNSQQVEVLRAEKKDVWCLRHKKSAWYFTAAEQA